MRRSRALVVGVAVFLVAVQTHLPEPGHAEATPLQITVEGPLKQDAVVALVDPSVPRVLERGRNGELRVSGARPEYEVWVGAPDCDLWRESVGQRTQITCTLAKTSHVATLTLALPSGHEGRVAGSLHVLHSLKPSWSGDDRERPFKFTSKSDFGDVMTVRVPAGYLTRVMLTPESTIVWPASLDLEPEEKKTIAVVVPRSMRFRAPDLGAQPLSLERVALAYAEKPPSPPALADAVQWWMSRPRSKLQGLGVGEYELSGLPPTTCHVFLSAGNRCYHHRALPEDRIVNLPSTSRWEVLVSPTVDRAPCPPHTRMLPGRLDLRTALQVVETTRQGTFFHEVATLSSPLMVAQSTSDTFTLLLPDKGIAYGKWTRGALDANRCPGTIVLEFPAAVGKYTASVYPAWEGGQLRASPMSATFEHVWVGASSGTVSGLPDGEYHVAVAWRSEKTADEGGARAAYSVLLDGSNPTRRVVVEGPAFPPRSR